MTTLLRYCKSLTCKVGDSAYYVNINDKDGKISIDEPLIIPCKVTLIAGSFCDNVFVCAKAKDGEFLIARQELFCHTRKSAEALVTLIKTNLDYAGGLVYFNRDLCDSVSVLSETLDIKYHFSHVLAVKYAGIMSDFNFTLMQDYTELFNAETKRCIDTSNLSIEVRHAELSVDEERCVETDVGKCTSALFPKTCIITT